MSHTHIGNQHGGQSISCFNILNLKLIFGQDGLASAQERTRSLIASLDRSTLTKFVPTPFFARNIPGQAITEGARVVCVSAEKGFPRGVVCLAKSVRTIQKQNRSSRGLGTCELRRAWDGKDLSQGDKNLFALDKVTVAGDEAVATVLHLAILCRSEDAVELLLAACPELTEVNDAFGQSPLDFATTVSLMSSSFISKASFMDYFCAD